MRRKYQKKSRDRVRPPAERSAIQVNGPLVIGRNAVREVLRHAPERVVEVIVARRTEPDQEYRALLGELEAARLRIRQVDPKTLANMAKSDSHQSFGAVLTERPMQDLTELLDFLNTQDRAVLLMLDGITDPQNFGAILRSAECFGCAAVIWSRNNSPSITPSLTKASVGASELLPLVQVGNLHDVTRKLREYGFFSVVATLDDSATPLPKFSFPEKTLLIVGAEGSGVRSLLTRTADAKVYIPMLGKIQSLNVSQATALLLYQASHQGHGPLDPNSVPQL